MARVGAAVILAALACGCDASDPVEKRDSGTDVADAGGGAAPSPPETVRAGPGPLRLLDHGEYERTLRQLFGDSVVDAAATQLLQLSDPKPAHGFRSQARGTTAADVEARFHIADAIALQIARTPEALAGLVPCLAEQPPSARCVSDALGLVGLQLFRRRLDAAEFSWLRGVYDDAEQNLPGDGLHLALFALLQSPYFLYRVETRGTANAGDPAVITLTANELATRLAFLVWGRAPDLTLLQAAEAGALDSDGGLRAELQRLLAAPQARDQFARFFQQWLEFEELPVVNQSVEFLGSIAGPGLSSAMQRELTQTLLALTFDDAADFSALHTTTASFVPTSDLAELYGIVLPVAGSRTQLDPALRAGILTRPALLLGSGETTSPIRRGAFVQRQLLCEALPRPDPNSFPPGAITPPEFDPHASSRERWQAKTAADECRSCHQQFNPFGFALEHYDAIGRYREQEPLVDPLNGATQTQVPIDSRVDIVIDGVTLRVDGALELGQALAHSEQARACLARQWLRFASGRLEQDSDAPLLGEISSELARGASLLAAFERVVLAPEFRTLRLEDP